MKAILVRLSWVLALFAAGCASPASNALQSGQEDTVAGAPLGSRIKRRSGLAPVQGARREDIEQGRVQSSAVATGMVNDGKSLTRP